MSGNLPVIAWHAAAQGASAGSNGRLVQQASVSALCTHDSTGLQAGDYADLSSRSQSAAGVLQTLWTDLYSASLRFLAVGLLSGAFIQDLMSPLSASRSKQATPRTTTTGRPLCQVRPASGDCRCLIVAGSIWRAINSGTGSWLVCFQELKQPHWPPGHQAYSGCWQHLRADLNLFNQSKRPSVDHGEGRHEGWDALFQWKHPPTASCSPYGQMLFSCFTTTVGTSTSDKAASQIGDDCRLDFR